MDKPWWEDSLCWFCDYGMFVIVFLLILMIGVYRFVHGAAPALPVSLPTALSTPEAGTPVAGGDFPIKETAVPPSTIISTVTFSPIPEKPEFIIVFVPVNWELGQTAFEQAAQSQADVFINESGIESYFTVNVIMLETGMEDVSLTSNDLALDVMEFALQVQPGDRYVGLTNGDLSPNGESDVVGWTSGGVSLVAEYQDEYVVTHELGHTFGLCDEYSYSDWLRQQAGYGSCPNDYPESCPKEEGDGSLCKITPPEGESNSIMGLAGLPGKYSFNPACLDHLQDFFSEESKQ